MRVTYLFLLLITMGCSRNPHDTVAFEYNNYGHLLIPVSIDGNPPIFGLFDTGAAVSILLQPYSDNYELPISKEYEYAAFPYLHNDIMKLYKTKPLNFSIGRLKSKIPISFPLVQDTFAMKKTLWGMDVIEQFCWHFDIDNKTVSVSTAPKRVNPDYIAFPYIVKNRRIFIQLNLYGKTKLDYVHLDTGKGIVIDGDVLYPVHLEVPKGSRLIDTMTIYTEPGIAMYPKTANDFKVDTRQIFEYSGPDTPVNYYGVVISRAEDYKIDPFMGSQAILSISHWGAISSLYMDTRNQIIYIKPKSLL